MGPGDLERIISKLPRDDAPELLSSFHTGEDAGVYLLRDDLAIVQTVDFFPPIVDDPYTFGQIAAANSLSDIYAMGASPITALNIVAFPCEMEGEILEQVMLGGYGKVLEAGAHMVGGHTIEDEEPKYGLAVTGVVKPSEILSLTGAKPGDVLVLTKPIGTGILATALKSGIVTEEEIAEAIDSMRALNRGAADAFSKYEISACTDVTGFGLLGHLYEMTRASSVGADVWAGEVPLFERTLEMASMGMLPEGKTRNREYVSSAEVMKNDIDGRLQDCLYDPQTSGGLLAAVPPGELDTVIRDLRDGGSPRAAAIGVIRQDAEGKIKIVAERV